MINQNNCVSIELSLTCNSKCIFCSRNAHDTSNVDKNTVFKQIEESNAKAIEFSGGEALLNTDIIEYIEFAKNKGKKVFVITNGCALEDEDLCKEVLSRIDLLKLSVHSLNKKTYEYITDTKGNWKKLRKALKNVKKYSKIYKVPLLFNTVILKSNCNELVSSFKKLRRFPNIDRILYSYPFYDGRMLENKEEYIPISNFSKQLKKIGKLSLRYKINLNSCNIPFCIVFPYQGVYNIEHNSNFFKHSKQVIPYGKDEADSFWVKLQKSKQKNPNCSLCKLNTSCYGMPKEYIKEYGKLDDLPPIEY